MPAPDLARVPQRIAELTDEVTDPIRPFTLGTPALVFLVGGPYLYLLYRLVLRPAERLHSILTLIEAVVMLATHWTLIRWWLFVRRRSWPRVDGVLAIDPDRFDLVRAVGPTVATAVSSGLLLYVTVRGARAIYGDPAALDGPGGSTLVVLVFVLLGVFAGSAVALLTFDVTFPWLVVRAWWRRARRWDDPGFSAAAALYASVRDLGSPWDAGSAQARRKRVRRRLGIAAELATRDAVQGDHLNARRDLAATLRNLGLVIADCGDVGRERVRVALEQAALVIADGGWGPARAVLQAGLPASYARAPIPRGEVWRRRSVTALAVVGSIGVMYVVLTAALGPGKLFDAGILRLWAGHPPSIVVDFRSELRQAFMIVIWALAAAVLQALASWFRGRLPIVAGIFLRVVRVIPGTRGASSAQHGGTTAANDGNALQAP